MWVATFTLMSSVCALALTKPLESQLSSSSFYFLPERSVNITSSLITEASGIAASRKFDNVVYLHNDSGGKNRVYAVDAITGTTKGVLTFGNFTPYDMEDISVGPCNKGFTESCIYIIDSGYGHHHPPGRNMIYRIKEPTVIGDQHLAIDAYMHYTWSENNTETVLVDDSANVYIISKRTGGHGYIGKMPQSGWNSKVAVKPETVQRTNITASFTPPHPYWYNQGPTGGDISPDGTELLIRQYEELLYWSVPDKDYLTAVTKPGRKVAVVHQVQSEAVAWDTKGEGYYTTSEGKNAQIYYYKRFQSPIIG